MRKIFNQWDNDDFSVQVMLVGPEYPTDNLDLNPEPNKPELLIINTRNLSLAQMRIPLSEIAPDPASIGIRGEIRRAGGFWSWLFGEE